MPRSIGRLLDLFEIVVAHGECNLTTAASAARLTPTTALRYLRALEARGYLRRSSSGAYAPGPTSLRLAASLRGGTALDRLVATAQTHLATLAQRTGESTYLAISDGRTATYVATAESPRAIRHVGWVGQDVALDGTALGAAFSTPGTTTTRTGAVEPDITAMSRAIPTDDTIALAISIVGPAHRFDADARAAHDGAITTATDALARELVTTREEVGR